ncbi:MAG: cache domain-containing protein [Spirochaetes bacterium]|nr:cache domain-containing protein [Spirochaetota bacterium]
MENFRDRFSWKNITLQSKIFICVIFTIVCFIVLVFGYFIPTMKDSLIVDKKMMLENLVDTGITVFDKLNSDAEKGKITVEEAKTTAKEIIKNMRYGDEGKDYLWINNFQPAMIMHPFRPDLDGKDVSEYSDPTGKRLFVEMKRVCEQYGQGYVNYSWQWKDDNTKIVPKISFVKNFKSWNWILGTGIYIEDVNEEIAAITAKMVIIFLCISVLLAAVLFVVSRAISKPVRKILDFARELASGNFRKRIDLNQEDELGKLASALNMAANNLDKVVTEITEFTVKFAQGDLSGRLDVSRKEEMGMLGELSLAMNTAVDDLDKLLANTISSVQNLATAVEEISNGNQNLSQRTSEQASSLEEIASTIEESTVTIIQNANNAETANGLAEQAAKNAEDGESLVNKAVVSINEIYQLSKKIARIITTINEITFQTNLLALNAAVEAARVGEQGKGFAVVAGEVRSLAQRSAKAAKEISDLISYSVKKIKTGTLLVNKSGKFLKGISTSVKDVSSSISEIAAASREQKIGVEQLNKAVVEMDTMTQQNAALVEETASASEEMASQAEELMYKMEKFIVTGFNISNINTGNTVFPKKGRTVHRADSETLHTGHLTGITGSGFSGTMKDEDFEGF